MALHPGHHQRGQAIKPLPRRTRERVAGSVFEAVTRVAGLRPSIIPEHMRRQLRIIGASDEQIARVLPRLRSLGEWPYVWEAEGDARAAEGDWRGAFAAWYVAQRILLAPSPLKRRLYQLAVGAYARMEQPPLERFTVRNKLGDDIAGYLQLPYGARGGEPVACVLMVPGVTGTKEELHPYCMPFLRRGLAVARIDSPVYGETTGLLTLETAANARFVVPHLAADPRLNSDRIHLHGMSMGAHFALTSAVHSHVASITVICPPFTPGVYLRDLPTLNLTAIQHMTRREDIDGLVAFADELSLKQVAPHIEVPVRIFHGGRDRTIPIADGIALAEAVGGPSALTIFERDHHNCLEHIDEITALTLEFLRDPHGACARREDVERVDVAATVHATDRDARRAVEGLEPTRRRVRLPFAWRHARSSTS